MTPPIHDGTASPHGEYEKPWWHIKAGARTVAWVALIFLTYGGMAVVLLILGAR